LKHDLSSEGRASPDGDVGGIKSEHAGYRVLDSAKLIDETYEAGLSVLCQTFRINTHLCWRQWNPGPRG
jgi:hypothetical protein